MFEKVNPKHPDKIADRIAGAIVDLAYFKSLNPFIAVEVLIGHGIANIIIESSLTFTQEEIQPIVDRLCEKSMKLNLTSVKQDSHLTDNQKDKLRCGDNGIFYGYPTTEEEAELHNIAEELYNKYCSDGKYILDLSNNKLIICQSNADTSKLKEEYPNAIVNPLGDWTGGLDVDSGATNRKLGSDMGQAISGGGLHGKDLSKADVSINIYAFIKANLNHTPVKISCAIGDEVVDGIPYSEIVKIAQQFIQAEGGFEKFAEWGLI